MRRLIAACLSLLFGWGCVVPAAAADMLRVGIMVSPPFVTATSTGYKGFAIELWEQMAGDLGLTYQYVPIVNLPALFDAVQSGQVDIAVSDLSVTASRLRRIEFTQPWYDAGLRLMIDQDRHQGFGDLLHNLRASGHLRVYGYILLIVIGATLILTLIDRRFDPDFPRIWGAGLAESFYQVMSVATSGKAPHKPIWGPWGRIIAALWMVCGVGVLAYFTSSITSVMTVATITNQVGSLSDLSGKTVGVITGSVGDEFARDAVLQTRGYSNLVDAADALLKHQVAAVLHDAPLLEYFDNSHPELPVTEVGALLRPEKYAFALPIGSPLTHRLDIEIVAEKESGFIDKLNARYFGVTP